MAFKKIPALPTVLFGALLGGVFAVLLQPEIISTFVNRPDLSKGFIMISGVWTALFSGFVLESGVSVVDDLLTRGGDGKYAQYSLVSTICSILWSCT